MKKKWIIASAIAITVLAVAAILIVCLTQDHEKPKDLKDILNKEVTLMEGILYCDGVTDETFEDDFSKVYSHAATIKVESIDETTMMAKVTVVAPPLRDIMESCLPKDSDGDYDAVFTSYMSKIYDAIRDCPEGDKVSTTLECKVIEEDGLKLVPTGEFTDALFPDVQQLLSEVMLDLLSTKEG